MLGSCLNNFVPICYFLRSILKSLALAACSVPDDSQRPALSVWRTRNRVSGSSLTHHPTLKKPSRILQSGPFRPAGNRPRLVRAKKSRASANNAAFFETEIAAAPRSWASGDAVINQLKQQDSAGFKNPAGEQHMRFRRGGVAGGMIVHQDERIGRVSNQRLKHFARMGERFIDTALANSGDLD